jgi:NAD(P)-dependent dehydrogenase (short-subunit alcohol dehydrogenase family)
MISAANHGAYGAAKMGLHAFVRAAAEAGQGAVSVSSIAVTGVRMPIRQGNPP